jgi:hypothetical protein
MNEEASAIHDYLPIRRNEEEKNYADHLWSAVQALDDHESVSRPFAMMPFHLLFMLATYYRIIRIFKESKENYKTALILQKRERDKLLEPESVFDMALLSEKDAFEIFKLVDISKEDIGKFRKLVEERDNSFAHANGNIEKNSDDKIKKYLTSLDALKSGMLRLNDNIADEWLKELKKEEKEVGTVNIDQFLEVRLFGSNLCKSDFTEGKLLVFAILSSGDLNSIGDDLSNKDWREAFKLALSLAQKQAIAKLQHICKNSFDDDSRRLSAVHLLKNNGKLTKRLKSDLLKKEKYEKIIELLRSI